MQKAGPGQLAVSDPAGDFPYNSFWRFAVLFSFIPQEEKLGHCALGPAFMARTKKLACSMAQIHSKFFIHQGRALNTVSD